MGTEGPVHHTLHRSLALYGPISLAKLQGGTVRIPGACLLGGGMFSHCKSYHFQRFNLGRRGPSYLKKPELEKWVAE